MMLFDVVKGIVRWVPLIKSILLDSDLGSYIVSLLVAALYKVGDAVRVS